jgi:hypothetical protein
MMLARACVPLAASVTIKRMSTDHDRNKSQPSKLRKPNRFVVLLLLLVLFQNIIIYKLMRGTSTGSQFSRVMESMIDLPRHVAKPFLQKQNDVIVYLAQFSNAHSSYGEQFDAASKNITGLSKFKRSLDLCTL